VAQVNIAGADSATLNVVLDPTRLAAAGSASTRSSRRCGRRTCRARWAGDGPITERAIRLEGRLTRPEDFGQLTVAQRGGVAIPLAQVATVEAGSAERRSAALYNGREAIGIDIVKARGYSTTQVSEAVKARLTRLRAQLPPGTSVEIVRDAGERVRQSVRNVQEALVEGAALTVLVVFLFLNSWRSTVITGLALPVSALASFVPLWVFGFTLNTMSLLGLSLAIGILIDDAIVVRENIVRHVEMGKDHFDAAREGTDEIGLAVAATTFSIVAVFVPVGFMSGFAGQWFQPFALTIAASVLVSLFVSFSLDPMLSAYWPDPRSSRDSGATHRARARPVQPLVRPARAALPPRRGLGARPPAGDGRAGGGLAGGRGRAAGALRRLRLHARERPQRDHGRRRGAARLQLEYTRLQAELVARPDAHARGGRVHVHDRRQRLGLWGGRRGVGLRAAGAAAERDVSQQELGARLRASCAASAA
jgi:HAE1 family hydrophobic/amphiphilic exporter-1